MAQPYQAWRDGFDVKVELQLRLQQTLERLYPLRTVDMLIHLKSLYLTRILDL